MRCTACNVRLNELELRKKHPTTKEHVDLCTKCYNVVVSELMYSDNEASDLFKEEPLTNIVNCDTL